MKFSIVIPVYNVEKYIDKCLNSVLNQTYEDFEVIIVNDGTKDNSQKIIDKYVNIDKRFKCFKKENGGLSDARNYGVKYAKGDYLVFIDSDDYVSEDYLNQVNMVLTEEKNIDVVKIKLIIVNEEGKELRREDGLNKNGNVEFSELVSLEFLEPAWSYIYNLNFWNKNKFEYSKGKYHEDFGLTPEILVKAKNIYYLDYYSYYYVQRPQSIMSSNSNEKIIKKAYDMLEQYDRLIGITPSKKENTKIYKSFLSNALISKSNTLKGNDKKIYIKELNKRNVLDYILTDTFKRKIKKMVLKIKFRIW